MAEFIRTGPDMGTTPPSYTPEVHREFIPVGLPPGIGMKPETIVLKRPILIGSILTMVIGTTVTFWIPFFNGLIGGVFGGYHAGRMKRALAAATVTSIVVPGALYVLLFMSRNDSAYLFYGLGFRGWALLHIIGTFIGAVAGAASRPLTTGDYLPRAPLGVSASPTPVPGAAPMSRPTTSTESVTTPPSGPVREE
ncbi:hypothetical protein [Pyxidicoccus trucidator]|uniref:hypothetical protein n=1 Tax=Pyxidicoccus trucidator TaxID=2709662 RepID=UPI0013D9EDCB|nr:hypothetical protein [Pyxidicoccus trucidator]